MFKCRVHHFILSKCKLWSHFIYSGWSTILLYADFLELLQVRLIYNGEPLAAVATKENRQIIHSPKIWRTKHHKKVDDRMSRVNADNVDAALSEAQSQDVMVQSHNSSIETVLSQFTGIEFTNTHHTNTKCQYHNMITFT